MPIETLTPDQLRARNTMKWTRQASDVLPLWVAEMDVVTCPAVSAAVQEAARREVFGYPSDDRRLEQATADWCAHRYGWAVDPDRVVELPDVLVGVRAAIDHLTVPGSPIVLPVPAYMPFFDVLRVTGRQGIFVPMLPVSDPDGTASYRFDLEALTEAFRGGAGGMILCNPYNPLGAVFPAEHLAQVCELAARYGVRVISDEIHATLVYDRRHVPTASVSEAAAQVTVTVLASSKGFNTPGLKCAQLVLSNDEDARTWSKVHRFTYQGASTLGREATVAAYRHGEPWLDELLVFLRDQRDFLVKELPAAVPGLHLRTPEATYLAWVDLREVPAVAGADPAQWLLERAKVFVNPGPAFGAGGEGHVRVNFGTSRLILEEFVQKVGAATLRR